MRLLVTILLLAAASPAYALRTAAPLVARPRLARSAPPVCAARPPRGGGGKNPHGDSAPLAAGAASLAALALGVGNLNALVGATIIAAVVAPEAFDKLGDGSPPSPPSPAKPPARKAAAPRRSGPKQKAAASKAPGYFRSVPAGGVSPLPPTPPRAASYVERRRAREAGGRAEPTAVSSPPVLLSTETYV